MRHFVVGIDFACRQLFLALRDFLCQPCKKKKVVYKLRMMSRSFVMYLFLLHWSAIACLCRIAHVHLPLQKSHQTQNLITTS